MHPFFLSLLFTGFKQSLGLAGCFGMLEMPKFYDATNSLNIFRTTMGIIIIINITKGITKGNKKEKINTKEDQKT